MAAVHPDIHWTYQLEDGNPLSVPAGVTVKASINGSDVATYTTDADGIVGTASIAGAAGGDIAIFRIENHEGLAGSVSVRLT